jgi:hypothetical protein
LITLGVVEAGRMSAKWIAITLACGLVLGLFTFNELVEASQRGAKMVSSGWNWVMKNKAGLEQAVNETKQTVDEYGTPASATPTNTTAAPATNTTASPSPSPSTTSGP